MEYRVRNYTDELFDKLAHFYREMVGGVFDSRINGHRFLEKILNKPHFDPGKDLFVAETGDKILGILLILSEFRIRRIVLNCHVHHNYPYIKVASALWERGIARCQDIGGDCIHVCLAENFRAGRDFFAESGFVPVRAHVELEKNLEEPLRFVKDPEFGEVSHFNEGDEPRLRDLQNRIFTGSWGFSPNSVEEIEYYLDLTQIRVSDVLLLKDGDRLIGYLWAHPSIGGDSAQRKGRIHMFGIAPEYQGMGLGKKLLSIGLADLRDNGYKTVELTVDESNSPACTLYSTLGFKERFTSLWYEKSLKCD
ncbi:MAG: GNAT family N-acetyltransferase [Candidatus Aminicenantes bacterium]|jgi:ribosomal protein S18 acetylase RimI-like enzyme